MKQTEMFQYHKTTEVLLDTKKQIALGEAMEQGGEGENKVLREGFSFHQSILKLLKGLHGVSKDSYQTPLLQNRH